MDSIRILVVDDHEILRRHICTVLGTQPGLDVVAEACSGPEAIQKAEQHQPNVVLLDISIPEINGLMAAPLIKKVAPSAEILIVTSHDNLFFVREAFAAGVRGFLIKTDISSDLIPAVRQVHLKRQFVSKKLRAAALGPIHGEVAS
jgi:DNA-binding NarL/FixJ family response regulator